MAERGRDIIAACDAEYARSERIDQKYNQRGPKIVKQSLWNQIPQFVNLPLTIVITPFLIHHLGVASWGLYALVSTIQSVMTSLDGGLGATAIRYFGVYAGTQDRKSTARFLLTAGTAIGIAGVILTVIGWWAAPALASALHVPTNIYGDSVFFIRTISVLVTWTLEHSLVVALVQGNGKYTWVSLATGMTQALATLSLALVVGAGAGLRGVAIVLVAQQILVTLVILPAAVPFITWRKMCFLRIAEVREIGRYAVKAQASGAAWVVNAEVDGLLVGFNSSLQSVAHYDAASTLSLQIRSIASNALAPIGTLFANTFGSRGEEAAYQQYKIVQDWWNRGIVGMFTVAAVALYFATPAWLGREFQVAGVMAVILTMGMGCNSLVSATATFAGSIGRPDVSMRYSIAAVIGNVLFTIALWPFGPMGIVVGTSVGQLFGAVYFIRVARRRLGRNIPNFFRYAPWLAALGAAAITFALELAVERLGQHGALGLIVAILPVLPGLMAFVIFCAFRSNVRRDLWAVIFQGNRPWSKLAR